MYFSMFSYKESDTTREMALCVTPELEKQIDAILYSQRQLNPEEAAEVDLTTKYRKLVDATSGKVLHFWEFRDWDHPVDPGFVSVLYRVLATVAHQSFQLLRVSDEGELEEYGTPGNFKCFSVSAHSAPRITW